MGSTAAQDDVRDLLAKLEAARNAAYAQGRSGLGDKLAREAAKVRKEIVK